MVNLGSFVRVQSVLARVLAQPLLVGVRFAVSLTSVGPLIATVIDCVAGDTYCGRRSVLCVDDAFGTLIVRSRCRRLSRSRAALPVSTVRSTHRQSMRNKALRYKQPQRRGASWLQVVLHVATEKTAARERRWPVAWIISLFPHLLAQLGCSLCERSCDS